MDWNWFFSSFSQSCAAIIGIIGAFVISKLIEINSGVDIWNDSISQLLIEKNDLIRKIKRYDISKFNQTIIIYDKSLWPKILNSEFDNLSNEDIQTKLLNETQVYPNDPKLIQHFLKSYGKFILKKTDQKQEIDTKKSERSKTYSSHMNPIYNDAINNEKPKIEELRFSSKNIIEKFIYSYSRLESFNSSLIFIKKIIILLLSAIIITVVYPLSFMPIGSKSPSVSLGLQNLLYNITNVRSILLIAFTLIVITICGVLLINIKNLRIKIKNQINKRDENIDMQNYSPFFN